MQKLDPQQKEGVGVGGGGYTFLGALELPAR